MEISEKEKSYETRATKRTPLGFVQTQRSEAAGNMLSKHAGIYFDLRRGVLRCKIGVATKFSAAPHYQKMRSSIPHPANDDRELLPSTFVS